MEGRAAWSPVPGYGAEGWMPHPETCTDWTMAVAPTFVTVLSLKASASASMDRSWETGWKMKAFPLESPELSKCVLCERSSESFQHAEKDKEIENQLL